MAKALFSHMKQLPLNAKLDRFFTSILQPVLPLLTSDEIDQVISGKKKNIMKLTFHENNSY